MAGRGTDIVLGGKQEENDKDWEDKHNQVIEAGGLHVIGTERHESRRIDSSSEVDQVDKVIQVIQGSFIFG